MSLFRNVIFIATIAGLIAGLTMAVMQSLTTTPLILQAETFENAAARTTQTAPPPAAHDHGATVAANHHSGQDAWAPADGTERLVYTVMANVVTAIGFGMILVAFAEFAGGLTGWRNGMIWGFAGFAVFTLAPGLGLPPELPAMPAADLIARQTWWLMTVGATAAGLALIAFSSHALLAVAGAALILAPHLIGAPQPTSHASPIPHELHREFIIMTTLANLVFWLLLGALAGLLRTRFFADQAEGARVSLV